MISFIPFNRNLSISFLVYTKWKQKKSKFSSEHQVLSFYLLCAIIFQITKPLERLICFPFFSSPFPLPPLPPRDMISFGISVSQAIQLLKQRNYVDNHKEFAKKLTFIKSFSNNLWRNAVNHALKYTLYLSIYKVIYCDWNCSIILWLTIYLTQHHLKSLWIFHNYTYLKNFQWVIFTENISLQDTALVRNIFTINPYLHIFSWSPYPRA